MFTISTNFETSASQRNYREILLHDITPFGLQLKKKAAINEISPNFDNQWNKVLKGVERKLLR